MAPEALAPGVANFSHLESLEMKCKLFYELFCTTEDPRFLQAIKDAVADASPTLRFGPHANDEGEAAFLAFDVKTPLNDERIANLIEIVKVNTQNETYISQQLTSSLATHSGCYST